MAEKTIGILGGMGPEATLSLQGGLFQQVLQEHRIDTIVPLGENQGRVMSAIYDIKGSQGVDARKACKEVLTEVASHLIGMNAGGIVAGCTEIPLALFPEDIGVPLFNPLSILASAAVRIARS